MEAKKSAYRDYRDFFDNSSDDNDEPPEPLEEEPRETWLQKCISWSKYIGYFFGEFRVLVERILDTIVHYIPPILLKMHAIFPAVAYFFYGIKELLSCFHTLTLIERHNYKEKLFKAFIELATAALYLLTAASYGSLAFFTVISFPTAAILAAVGTTLSWAMLDLLRVGVDDQIKQNPFFGFCMVVAMWLFAANALLAPPVAILGMTATVAAGTGCMILSVSPIIATIVKAVVGRIIAGANKLYRCCCCVQDAAVPDNQPAQTPGISSPYSISSFILPTPPTETNDRLRYLPISFSASVIRGGQGFFSTPAARTISSSAAKARRFLNSSAARAQHFFSSPFIKSPVPFCSRNDLDKEEKNVKSVRKQLYFSPSSNE